MNRFAIFIAATELLLCTASAEAYIGPGAGLSLLGALWALIAAIAAALGFILLWPIRRARKRRLAQKKLAVDHPPARDATPDAMDEIPEAPTR
jgi:membrane protein implicated in regulation of membrane protease activity